jgi:hypothetical protein
MQAGTKAVKDRHLSLDTCAVATAAKDRDPSAIESFMTEVIAAKAIEVQ